MRHHVENLPILLPLWSINESMFIWDSFQSILAKTKIWLQRRGLKCIKIESDKGFDPVSSIGQKSKIRGKGKDKTSTYEVQTILKLTIKVGKATVKAPEINVIEPEKIYVESSKDEMHEEHVLQYHVP